jgi:hypothetical protein
VPEFTPSPEAREALDRAIGAVLFNVSNFPEKAQVRLLGQDMGPLRAKLVEAVLSSEFARHVTDPIRALHQIGPWHEPLGWGNGRNPNGYDHVGCTECRVDGDCETLDILNALSAADPAEREMAGGAPCMECSGESSPLNDCANCGGTGSVEPWSPSVEAPTETPKLTRDELLERLRQVPRGASLSLSDEAVALLAGGLGETSPGAHYWGPDGRGAATGVNGLIAPTEDYS